MVTIDGLETVPPKDEVALMKGVTMHPITVALCVGDWIKDWRAYTGGILHTPGTWFAEARTFFSCVLGRGG